MGVLKLVAGVLAAPLALALLIALIGLIFRFLRQWRLSTTMFVAALAIAVLGSIPVLGDTLLRPLEARYPSLREREVPASEVSAIVVLGSYYKPWPGRSVTGALSREGLLRISEGVRLARIFPEAKLILSGGAPIGAAAPSARGYERFALEMGIPAERLVVVDTPLDTAQEALVILDLTAKFPPVQKLILVTSASHMPRAMKLVERAGAQAVPAPSGQRVGSGGWAVVDLIPSSVGLAKTEMALHEYAGLAAIALGLD